MNRSAGYQVSMEDELQYYNADSSSGWLVARDCANRNVGFIRRFEQGADWSLGEIFIETTIQDRKSVAQKLLSEFNEKIELPAAHRLRFDISNSDVELNGALEELGFSQKKKEFHHYEIPLISEFRTDTAIVLPTRERAREVAETLSCLHPVTETEAIKWIEEDSIRAVSMENRISSAAQVYDRGCSAEINRIATHSDFMRKGSATTLLHQVCRELRTKGKTTLFLKVENIRQPAISFYKSFGFSEVKEKGQVWHSRRY